MLTDTEIIYDAYIKAYNKIKNKASANPMSTKGDKKEAKTHETALTDLLMISLADPSSLGTPLLHKRIEKAKQRCVFAVRLQGRNPEVSNENLCRLIDTLLHWIAEIEAREVQKERANSSYGDFIDLKEMMNNENYSRYILNKPVSELFTSYMYSLESISYDYNPQFM